MPPPRTSPRYIATDRHFSIAKWAYDLALTSQLDKSSSTFDEQFRNLLNSYLKDVMSKSKGLSLYKPIPPLSEHEIEKIWAKVDKRGPDECWPWTGRQQDGYGVVGIRLLGDFRVIRVIVVITTGVDPESNLIMHSCNNRPCCNPNHLKPGTQKQNRAYRVGMPWPHASKPGMKHPRARLTDNQVRDIRRRRSSGEKLKDLADEYKVSIPLISKIHRADIWSHVLNEDGGIYIPPYLNP